MNQAIADIIKGHISGLDFVDKIAGLTSVLTFDMRGPDNAVVQKSFPVACCVTPDECEKQGAYNDLMPNSEYKTVIYFEDNGVSFEKAEGNWKYYKSSLRLIAWLNIEKLTESGICKSEIPCTYAAHVITEIIRSLPEFPQNTHGPIERVYSEITSQIVRNPSIFSAYTYDEKHVQYLMAPFDYFALTIETGFAICLRSRATPDSTCVPAIEILPPTALVLTVISDTEIDPSWTNNALNQAVTFERSLNGNDFVEIHRTLPGVAAYSNTGLIPGTRYYYRSRAFDGINYSAYTNVEDAITYAIQSPTDLTIATITGGNRLTWVDNSNNEDGFIIYVSIDGADFVQLALTLPDVTTYDDLVSTGVLEYKVVAFIGSSYSEFSDVVSTTLSTYFVTTWNTENAGSATKTIEIPTNGTGYDCYIDWSDGVIDHVTGTPTGNKITHLYSTTGIKTVKISGLFPTIKFNNLGDKLKLLTIENWGYISWTSFAYGFYGCANLEGHYTDNPITDNCTSMIYTFRGCAKFNSPIICNTANVTDMQQMFNAASIFNQSVANFNLVKVTNMTMMFQNANALSTANYDAMLIAWGAQAVKNTVTFHAGDAKYSAGGAAAAARAHLVLAVISGGHGWTITDGGAL